MTLNGWLQIALFFLLILAVTKPLGIFIARVFAREKTFLDPILRPVERLLYRVTGVDEAREMGWMEYAVAMLLFSLVSMLLLYVMQRVQYWLPFNPQKLTAVSPGHLAWNTAASFTTNTNWQAYSGETTMSYFTQMAGLAYHNFVSAATGIALAVAFIRGIARREAETIGNFWVDLVRASLWVLLPFCVVGSLVLVSQGVVQNLRPYDTVKLVEAQKVPHLNADGKPAVGADGQVQLHDVVKLTVAAEDLHLTVFKDVPGCADTRSNLGAPAKVDRRGVHIGRLVFGGKKLMLDAEAGIDGDAVRELP